MGVVARMSAERDIRGRTATINPRSWSGAGPGFRFAHPGYDALVREVIYESARTSMGVVARMSAEREIRGQTSNNQRTLLGWRRSRISLRSSGLRRSGSRGQL